MAYPAPPPHASSVGSSGLDETDLLAAVRGLRVGPETWTRGFAAGDREEGSAVTAAGGRLSERDYRGARRGPFAVQRAALSLFAAWLERRCGVCHDRSGTAALQHFIDWLPCTDQSTEHISRTGHCSVQSPAA